jgi:TolA-binding protein
MNSSGASARALRSLAVGTTALALILTAGTARAQSTDSRLNKVEAEVRALQRKVFPGGDGKFFTPEITPGTTTQASPPPATTAVSDMLVRMDAIEGQMARLTGQVEQNANRIAQLEAKLAAGASAMTATDPAPAPTTGAAQSNLGAMSGGASTPAPTPTPAATAQPAPASRVSAVSAIVKPQTDDAGDDEYSYGFRLWDANFYPEAQQQLKMFVEKYPNHSRISWGRNLLGRAYLDDGNPREAAKWFLQNYQADKRGARAPDSLLFLAMSMKQLKDTNRACIALAEFSETYAAEASGRLASLYASTRNGLDCSA